jgi:L-rhamnonate dehydratase
MSPSPRVRQTRRIPLASAVDEIRAWVPVDGGAQYYPRDTDVDHWLTRSPIASPLARYPGHETLGRVPMSLGAVAVEVCCSDGLTGIGVAHGGEAACFIIESAFDPLLRGCDSTQIAELWERMQRAATLYGSDGIALAALSGIDLALWDLAGKRADLPVYALIGDTDASTVPLYATGPRPNQYEADGFHGAKVSLPWGPTAGADGLTQNIEFLRSTREEVDPDFPLAVDCLMGLTFEYATALFEATRGLGLIWFEEPLLAWELESLASLRTRGMPVASGEHNGASDLRRMIHLECVDVLQPDVTWCGGLTEALRLHEATRGSDIRLIPHCGGIFSYHLATHFGDNAIAEFLFQSSDGGTTSPTFGDLVRGEPLPHRGTVALSANPGWDLQLSTKSLKRPYGRAKDRL